MNMAVYVWMCVSVYEWVRATTTSAVSNELDRDRVLFWTSLVRLPVPWWGRPAGQDAWLAAVQLCWEREEGVAVWLVKRLQRERVSFNLGSTDLLHRLPLQYLFGENNFEYLISSSSREWWKKNYLLTVCSGCEQVLDVIGGWSRHKRMDLREQTATSTLVLHASREKKTNASPKFECNFRNLTNQKNMHAYMALVPVLQT